MAFTEYVVKIHSRCNLSCDYCYMYEMADQSWLNQPKVMSRRIFDDSCRMIREHARRHSLSAVDIVFHGGEPLLAGKRNLEYFAQAARAALEPDTHVRLGIQTNGVLIDEEFLRICDRWDIRIGVSLDGSERGHDRHRLDRRGEGSYRQVVAGLTRLLAPEWRHLFSGLLCTIDLQNEPVETYEALARFEPPAIDFMLPHSNWVTPPPGRTADESVTPYADWLIAIFERWYHAPKLETTVRLFGNIIELLLGGRISSEAVGLEPVRLVVIETDGSLEQVDELKSAFAGATKLAIRGPDNPLDLALREPSIVARQIGLAALGDTCLACPVHTVCGGGHYVHRYREDTGFRNPSVYCADLKKLIQHIESRVQADIRAVIER
ncbi:FxsB family cyclophane-forming radical SAM/SPASM peptide maturase [Nocardia sp. NPDC023852]|uniref:FxsB family cyclophane-forming radical SAM/SPASM peptide maturase n=1 Tax=Nocardia sp. NPDC023852 TaxID=3154697 RepID=UPI0033D4D9C3